MRFATAAFSLVVTVPLASTMAAQQNPGIIFERRGPVPNSLEEMVSKSDLVVLIRIVGEEDRPRYGMPGTDFRARVIEIIKNAELSVGPEIRIHRDGGWMNHDDGTRTFIEERGFPLWRPGMTVVAGLTRIEDGRIFVSGKEFSIEQDENGRGKTFGRGAVRGLHGKPFDDVLARIRAAVR